MVRDWRNHGVKIVSSRQLDLNTPQTPGMTRAAAINRAMAGANKLWAGTVHIHPGAKTAPHHHGQLESIIYVTSGKARMRWGEELEFIAEAGPGDFIFVPPFVPHQESTPIRPSRSRAWWYAATKNPLSPIWTYRPPKTRKRYSGSIRFIPSRESL